MRRATIRGGVVVLVTLAAAPAARAGSFSGAVIERTRAGGQGSLGVSITQEELENLPLRGRNLVDLVRLVPTARADLKGIQAGHLPENWTFNPKTLEAKGPERPYVNIRFDFAPGWKPPAQIGLDCQYGGKSVFRQDFKVQHWNPVRTSNDYTDYFELPKTLRVGSPFVFDASKKNKLGYRYDWKIEPSDPKLDFGFKPISTWDGRVRYEGTVPDPFRLGDSFDPHPMELWPWDRPYRITGIDEFGESILDSRWKPTFLPPLIYGFGEPHFDAATEIVAPNSQLCICGNVPKLELWSQFTFGGRPLGSPLVATDSSAIYALPKGLTPGYTPIVYQPWQTAGRDTGLGSTSIDVKGSVDLEVIQRGGSTPLRLDILGSDRAFPFELANWTPAIIALEGGDLQQLSTPGGSPNQIVRTVTGLQPGGFRVVYKVKLPACPCEEVSQPVGNTCQSEYADLLSNWPSQQSRATQAPPELRAGEFGGSLGYSPAVRFEPFLFPGIAANAPPPAGCSAGQPLMLNDRFKISIDYSGLGNDNWGSCFKPGSDDTGSLYFFQPDNFETVVKVLNACPINNRYWVFAAATTDIEFKLTVTDTRTSAVKTYLNPAGRAAPPVMDTDAFATCP